MVDSVKTIYLRNRRLRAVLLATGIACLVASFGVASFFMFLPSIQTQDASVLATLLDKVVRVESHEIVEFSFSDKHVLAPFAFIAMLAIGVLILSRAKSDRAAFIAAYSHLDFSYSADEQAQSRKAARSRFAIGVALVGIGVTVFLVLRLLADDRLAIGVSDIIAAFGVWFIVYAFNSQDGIDVLIYNYQALRQRSIYSIEEDQTNPDREIMLAIKRSQLRAGTLNRGLITIGVLGSLALYFLPTLRTSLYWVPCACMLLACSVITHLFIRQTRAYYP